MARHSRCVGCHQQLRQRPTPHRAKAPFVNDGQRRLKCSDESAAARESAEFVRKRRKRRKGKEVAHSLTIHLLVAPFAYQSISSSFPHLVRSWLRLQSVGRLSEPACRWANRTDDRNE